MEPVKKFIKNVPRFNNKHLRGRNKNGVESVCTIDQISIYIYIYI